MHPLLSKTWPFGQNTMQGGMEHLPGERTDVCKTSTIARNTDCIRRAVGTGKQKNLILLTMAHTQSQQTHGQPEFVRSFNIWYSSSNSRLHLLSRQFREISRPLIDLPSIIDGLLCNYRRHLRSCRQFNV